MSDMVIRITLDAAQLKKELGLTQDELKKVDGKDISIKTDSAQSGIAKLRDGLAMWSLALNGAIKAAKGLASAVNSVVAPAMEQEKAALDLAAALKNTGVYSAQLESRLLAQASAIQAVTTYGDDAIIMATRQMQVIGQLSADQLPAAQKAAVGLAAAYKLDLNTAFEMVGKAAAGNTATLSRYGIVLEEGLDPQEKFAELLRVGADRFALARDEANTTSGALQQMNNLWGDLKEVIGTWILPLLGDVASAFSDVLKWIQGVSNHEKSAQKQTEDLAWQFDFLTNKVLEYKSQTSLSAQEQEEFNGYLKELQAAFPDYFGGMDMLTMKYVDVADSIANARVEVERLIDRMVLQAVMDDYSDDLIKVGKKIRTAQEELQKYQKMQEEGDEWVVVGPDMIRSVKMYINKYNDEIERFRKKKAEIIAERDAVAKELSVLPEPPKPKTPKKPNASGAGTGSGSGSITSTAESAKAEISETAKAYEQLLQQLQKYHDDRALAGLSAHQKRMTELSSQFETEQQIVLDSLSAKEITAEEAEARLAAIRERYDAEAKAAQIAADSELIEIARQHADQAIQDEETYYETMKFADADYYDWKKEQIRQEVEAMAIGDAEKLELIKQHIAELDALKEEYSSTDPETKSNWFFNGLLGFDPDNEEDIAKVQAIKDTYQSLAAQAQSVTGGMLNLSRQRKDQEIADLEARAAKERMSNEELAAQKVAITKKYESEERRLKNIQKTLSIGNAIMNVAEGVTKALALGPIIGPIMAGIISAMGAVQIGIIKAQKFAYGGKVTGPGGPKDDRIPALLSNGEYVVTAEATRKNEPLLAAINKDPDAASSIVNNDQSSTSTISDQRQTSGSTIVSQDNRQFNQIVNNVENTITRFVEGVRELARPIYEPIAQFAAGGMVRGEGGPRDDKNLALVSNGEYVVNAAAASKHLPLLEMLNENGQVRLDSLDKGLLLRIGEDKNMKRYFLGGLGIMARARLIEAGRYATGGIVEGIRELARPIYEPIAQFAAGGMVRGEGGPRDDKIPAMLSNGEYIIRAEATERYRPLLDAINFGRSVSVQPKLAYADGGVVSGGIDIGKKMDTLINQVNVLNMNLVKKDMKPVLNISGSVRDMLRVQDKSRVRMEDLGYDPNYA